MLRLTCCCKGCRSFQLSSLLFALLASPKLLSLGIVKVNFFSALAYSQLSLFSTKKWGLSPIFLLELLYQSLFAVNDINARFCNLVELAAGEVVNDFALCTLLYYLLYSGVVRL